MMGTQLNATAVAIHSAAGPPEIYLEPGDVIEFEVEKIGVLRNRIVKR